MEELKTDADYTAAISGSQLSVVHFMADWATVSSDWSIYTI